MDRIIKALLFSFISSAALAVGTTQVSNQAQGKKSNGNELMKCIYTPQADSQSSSLPTTKIGFKFSLERNNSNHIAVDTYTLNDSSQPVKQVGHAELVGATTEITKTTKTSAILASLSLAEDSPFDFQISVDATQAAGTDGRFTALVNSAMTFTGASYTAMTVQCRVAPEEQAAPAQ